LAFNGWPSSATGQKVLVQDEVQNIASILSRDRVEALKGRKILLG